MQEQARYSESKEAVLTAAAQVREPRDVLHYRYSRLRLGKGEINSDWTDLGRHPGDGI